MKTREELEIEGWERRSCEKEPRLSELAALYEELGFEVMLLPARPEDLSGASPECQVCVSEAALANYKTIYTRHISKGVLLYEDHAHRAAHE